MKTMSEQPRKEGVDFKFRDDLKTEKDPISIEILVEKYKGIVYNYGRVKFIGTDEEPILNFDYRVTQGDVDQEDAEFQTLIGDILISLIQESLEHNDRKDDPKTPDPK